MRIGRVGLKRKGTIKKKDFENIDEYKFEKNTNVIPRFRNSLICIMLSEEKGCSIILRKFSNKLNYFKFNRGKYLIDNEAIHITDNGARISVYLEGVSTPIKMSNIEKKVEEIKFVDLYGNTQTTKVTKIKGLKFDAKILDTFTNRKLAELFTKQTVDNFQFFLLLLLLGSFIVGVVNIIATYVFR